MSVCRCTHPMHEPAVMVGGRYVVGENPTARTLTSVPYRVGLKVGEVVEASGEFDSVGNAYVVRAHGARRLIDPRHLTPAPDPTAAPAVDEDLLRDLGERFTRVLFQTEAGQRLRAAWTADVVRERDEARATKDLHKERQQELEAALNEAVRERDEARAERERLRAALEKVAQAVGVPDGDRALDSIRQGIERLRAAVPSLPDVGPVTREVRAEVERSTRKHGDQSHLPNGTGPDLILRDLPEYQSAARADRLAVWAKSRCKAASANEGGDGTIAWEHILTEEFFEALAEEDPRALRAELVQVAAVAVKWVEAIDAEAVDHTHDDEMDAARDELGEAYCEAVGITDEHLRTVIRAVDAHRACNGQEAGL